MVMIPLAGRGAWMPEVPVQSTIPQLTAFLLDAAIERTAAVGTFYHPARAARNIVKVHFLLGNVVKAGGSNWRISLQGITYASNTPGVPNGIVDQSVIVPSTDATLVTNGWYVTAALSAPRAANIGDEFAVVLEFSGDLLGTDSIQWRHVTPGTGHFRGGYLLHDTTGVWPTSAPGAQYPNIVFECDDGSLGSFSNSYVTTQVGDGVQYHLNSVNDEHGNEFSFPFDCQIDGMWWAIGNNALSASYEAVLYNGSTVVVSKSFSGMTIGSNYQSQLSFPPVTYRAGEKWRQAIRPTSATSIFAVDVKVASAAQMVLHPMGADCLHVSRGDLGLWNAPLPDRRFLMGVRISAIDDGQDPIILPAAPTLAIADNGDGTGGVATISGSTAGTTNTVYARAINGVAGNPWVLQGSLVGNGTLNVATANGHYLWHAVSSNANGSAISNVVEQWISGGALANAVIDQVADAVMAALNLDSFVVPFTANRKRITAQELKQASTLAVTVLPRQEIVTILTRSRRQHDYRIVVGVQMLTESIANAENDIYQRLTEQIAEYFWTHDLPGRGEVLIASDADVPYVPEHLEQLTQFTSVTVLTFRGSRT